jgi:DNA-binding GntR family transcriptional regulator
MRRLLRDIAYERVRDRIIYGEDPPGALLREADLAAAIGVSKAPIREALTRLAAEGLVERKAQSHTRVTDIDTRAARDAVALIRLCHAEAVHTAQITDDDVTRMRAAQDRFVAALRAQDVRTALMADDEFHDVIVERAGNMPLADTIERWSPLIRRIEVARFSSDHAQSSIQRHEDLIDALAIGDTHRAVSITSVLFGSLQDDLHDRSTA